MPRARGSRSKSVLIYRINERTPIKPLSARTLFKSSRGGRSDIMVLVLSMGKRLVAFIAAVVARGTGRVAGAF